MTEDFYKTMLENIHEGFIYAKMVYNEESHPVNWRYEFVNEAYCLLINKSKEEILQKKASEINSFYPEKFQDWLKRFDYISKNKAKRSYEDFYTSKERWFHVAVFSIKPGYFAATFKELTDKKEIYKALKKQKNKFELLFNSINTGIIFQNQVGKVIDSNPAAEKILGLKYDQLTELKALPFSWKTIKENGDSYPISEFPPMRALKDKTRIENELMGIYNAKQKKYFWLRVNSVPLFSSNNIIGIVSTFNDISDKLKSRQKLETLNLKLIESNKNLEEFAYLASHDLKEPTRTVKSFADLLQKGLASKIDPKNQQILEYIIMGADRMQLMIEELLSYSRINTNDFKKESIDFNVLVNDVRLAMHKIIEEKNIHFTIQKLPTIEGSKMMLFRVIQNIIDNGLKYNDSEELHIIIDTEDIEDYCRISIRDNGIGIESQNFEKIFGLFKRLHNSPNYKGSGFGLAICKRVMEKHHGRILVESELGNGTTFHLDFPIETKLEE